MVNVSVYEKDIIQNYLLNGCLCIYLTQPMLSEMTTCIRNKKLVHILQTQHERWSKGDQKKEENLVHLFDFKLLNISDTNVF